MAIKTTGSLSFQNDIVAEFADAAPHSLSEFYGVDQQVPTTGAISFSDFYGATDLMSNQEIWDLLRNTNHAAVRNVLFSKSNFGSGMEISPNTSMFDNTYAFQYRYVSTINASYTWPDVFPAVVDDRVKLDKVSHITVFIRNTVPNGNTANRLVSQIRFGGVTYNAYFTDSWTETQSWTNWDQFISVFHINTGRNPLQGKTIQVTYNKFANADPNLQEMFVFPGKWNVLNAYKGVDVISCGTVVPNDLAMASKWADDGDRWANTRGNFLDIPMYEMLRRDVSFDDDTAGSRVAFANASGTLRFDAGRSYERGQVIMMRLEHA